MGGMRGRNTAHLLVEVDLTLKVLRRDVLEVLGSLRVTSFNLSRGDVEDRFGARKSFLVSVRIGIVESGRSLGEFLMLNECELVRVDESLRESSAKGGFAVDGRAHAVLRVWIRRLAQKLLHREHRVSSLRRRRNQQRPETSSLDRTHVVVVQVCHRRNRLCSCLNRLRKTERLCPSSTSATCREQARETNLRSPPSTTELPPRSRRTAQVPSDDLARHRSPDLPPRRLHPSPRS